MSGIRSAAPRPGSLPCLAAACFVSGCAALVYEVVWFQRLQLVLGSSTVSLGVLVATFMGGMGIGSLLAPRIVPSRWPPLVAFAALEAGIAACGLALHALVPLAGGVYASLAPEGGLGIAARGIVAAICLLPPTILMGVTLPTLAREAVVLPGGLGWVGLLQGANVAGGVAGCLLSALFLLPRYDVGVATGIAMLLNAVAAGLAMLPARGAAPAVTAGTVAPTRFTTVHAAIAVSGLTALASELIWTRLLALQCGGTVYTFALILAGFLAGLGLGNLAGAAVAAGSWQPRVALGWCQMLLVAAMAWAAHQIAGSLPHWPIDPALARSPAAVFQLDLVRCLWAVLPAAILWGASFPLAVAAVAGPGLDATRIVGGIAGANTIGGIAGALGAGVLLVAWLGSQAAQQAMMALAAGAGVLLVAPAARRPVAAAALAVAVAAAAILVRSTPPIPGQLVGYGRHSAAWDGRGEFLYVGEGLQASVAVSRSPLGRLHYHNAGKVQASSEPQDMRLQRMLGHLTTLVIERPRNVLVIGCGAGVTAGAVALDPRVERETIVEIEPLVPRSVAVHFGPHNHRVLDDPRVRVRIDDARHHLLVTQDTFDAITSDPLDPWVKGAAALFTEEFLSAARRRLNDGGVFTMFVQLYETSEPAVKSQLATFFRVFPDGVVFTNTQFGRGYDLVLLGRKPAAPIDVDAVETRLAGADMAAVAASLREVGIGSAVDLLATFAGTAADLAPWLDDAAINRDSNLRLQYLAGLGINLRDAADIHARLLEHPFRFPQGAFTGSPGRLEAVRAAVVRERGR